MLSFVPSHHWARGHMMLWRGLLSVAAWPCLRITWMQKQVYKSTVSSFCGVPERPPWRYLFEQPLPFTSPPVSVLLLKCLSPFGRKPGERFESNDTFQRCGAVPYLQGQRWKVF